MSKFCQHRRSCRKSTHLPHNTLVPYFTDSEICRVLLCAVIIVRDLRYVSFMYSCPAIFPASGAAVSLYVLVYARVRWCTFRVDSERTVGWGQSGWLPFDPVSSSVLCL